MPIDEDDFLLKFLRPCKFYADSAFRLLRNFYQFRKKQPSLAKNLIPSNLSGVLCSDIVTFLAGRDKNGCRVMLARIGRRWPYKIHSVNQLFRTIMMLVEVAMLEPATQVCGARILLDMDGLTLQHVAQFSPKFASQLLDYVQLCVPIRLKGIHIVNEPRIFSLLFAIFKPFLNEKLKRRVQFHGKDRSILIEKFGIDCLPTEFGGREDSPPMPPGHLVAELFMRYEPEFKSKYFDFYFNIHRRKCNLFMYFRSFVYGIC